MYQLVETGWRGHMEGTRGVLADSLQVLKIWVRPFWTSRSELFSIESGGRIHFNCFAVPLWNGVCFAGDFSHQELIGYNFQCWWTFLLMLCWTYLETAWPCLLDGTFKANFDIFSFCCMSWCENQLPYKFCLVSLCFIPSFWFLISFYFDSHLYVIYMLYIYIFLNFFIENVNSGNHHLNQFEEYNPVVFNIFTMLYNHHYLIQFQKILII